MTLYVPDELASAVRERLPGVVVSRVLQDALRGLLGCRHETTACAACAAPVDVHGERLAALRALTLDVTWALSELMHRPTATVEGAARVVVDVAARHGVEDVQAPRLARAARAELVAAAAPARLPVVAESRGRHPSARSSGRRRSAPELREESA